MRPYKGGNKKTTIKKKYREMYKKKKAVNEHWCIYKNLI